MTRKYSHIVSIFLLVVMTNIQATSIYIRESKEVTCECLGTYVRVGFETAADGSLTNVRVINSSSNATCDKSHIKRITTFAKANHPEGVIAIAVTGYMIKDKAMSYEQCLKTDEIELDTYWFVEEVLIDLEKINRK